MPEETKPEGQEPQPPAGNEPQPPSAPNQGLSADELLKQKQELEAKIKERDSRIADLETTKATIESRQKQIDEENLKKNADTSLQQRISQINERRGFDPDGADREMASLLSEVKSQAAKDAVVQARQIIAQETSIERLKSGVKSSNPAFDDDIVEVVMERANALAMTGKYKTAQEAVDAATEFVKTKFESYAQKKNAVPPLPLGAGAERGGANMPPRPPEPPKEKTLADEIAEANEAKRRKLL